MFCFNYPNSNDQLPYINCNFTKDFYVELENFFELNNGYFYFLKVGNFCMSNDTNTDDALYNARRKQRRNRTTFTLQQVCVFPDKFFLLFLEILAIY